VLYRVAQNSGTDMCYVTYMYVPLFLYHHVFVFLSVICIYSLSCTQHCGDGVTKLIFRSRWFELVIMTYVKSKVFPKRHAPQLETSRSCRIMDRSQCITWCARLLPSFLLIITMPVGWCWVDVGTQ